MILMAPKNIYSSNTKFQDIPGLSRTNTKFQDIPGQWSP